MTYPTNFLTQLLLETNRNHRKKEFANVIYSIYCMYSLSLHEKLFGFLPLIENLRNFIHLRDSTIKLLLKIRVIFQSTKYSRSCFEDPAFCLHQTGTHNLETMMMDRGLGLVLYVTECRKDSRGFRK